MSLVKTLGKIAIGVMVAKGVGKMAQNRQGGSGGSGGGLGGMLGGALGGSSSSSSGGGGLGGMLSDLMKGGGAGSAGGAAGTRPASGGGGGMGDLGALLGGRQGGGAAAGGMAGGLGGLLETLTNKGSGASAGSTGTPPGGSFGDMLNSALRGEEVREPDAGDEEHARLLLRAMINAAKSDGKIDAEEERKILGNLGGDDITEEDKQFVMNEMRQPLDVDAFAASVPAGHEEEVYVMSVTGINLDSQEEARYLDALRKGLNISEADANTLHEKLGVPTLYR